MLISEFDKILTEDPVRTILEDLYGLNFEMYGTNCEMAGRFFEKVYQLIDKEEVDLAIQRTSIEDLMKIGFRYIGLYNINENNKSSVEFYTNFYIGYNKDG